MNGQTNEQQMAATLLTNKGEVTPANPQPVDQNIQFNKVRPQNSWQAAIDALPPNANAGIL